MNQSQIHLALTHLPVILSLAGIVMLAISLIRKNKTLRSASFYFFVIAGFAALPVFFSGEGAEEIVEHLPGVSESLIEKHEGFAKFSLFAILITALIALAGLMRFTFGKLAKPISVLVLIFSISTGVLLAQTAHLGGQIRHTEIRTANAGINTFNAENNSGEKDED